VDAWASTEQSELNWIRHRQKELRSDVYQDIRNAVKTMKMQMLQQRESVSSASTHLV